MNKNQVNTSTLTSTTLATTNLSTSGGPLATNSTVNSSVSISSFITSIYSTAKNSSGTTGGQTQYTTIASTTLNRVTSHEKSGITNQWNPHADADCGYGLLGGCGIRFFLTSSSANALTTINLTTRSTISTNKNQVNTSSLTSTTLTTTNPSTSGGLMAANSTVNSSVSISSFITSIYSTAKNSSGTTGGQTQYTTIASTTLNRVTSPIHGSRTWVFVLSPGRDGHTNPDICQWWDSSAATQEALQHADTGLQKYSSSVRLSADAGCCYLMKSHKQYKA
uniref:Uncharacterized protein n=1 Tax=Romanomermis culicivorax TaxID=13658 RepID=A0A915K0R8_ROMCU